MCLIRYLTDTGKKGSKSMRKVNWGVLGTAGIAKGCTIPGMKLAENCELYAIAGRSEEKARAYQEEFGFGRIYSGPDAYEALLADPQVEAVYIPLPNSLHCEWTIKALQAKKHVLCEKPLAVSAEQAQEMIDAAKENGVFLMEAYAYLHSPVMKAIKADVESGIIGDVLYMESEFLTSDYDLSNIRMRRETYGGSLYDLGCYCTTQIITLLGEPDQVQAAAIFSDQQVDTVTTGILSYNNGCKAVFTCGMVLATEKDRRNDRLQIYGTKGKLFSDVEFNQAGELSYRIITDEGEQVKTVQTPQNYSLEVAQLGRCITEGETPYVTADFTMQNARTLDRILEKIGY